MKKVLSILLCIALLFSLGTIAVQAIPSGDLWIDEWDYYSSDPWSGEGWSWNGSTLELKNYNGNFIELPEGKAVTISISGSNTINSETFGIKINASTLTLTGTGSLTINAADSAILGEGTSTVTISSGTYEFVSSDAEAIHIDGTLKVNGDTVHAKTDASAPAILVYGMTLYDNIAGKSIDTNDTHGITFGTDVAYTNTSIKNCNVSFEENSDYYDDYYDDSYNDDYYDDPGGTGAKWHYTKTYAMLVSATNDNVTLDASNGAWTYAGDYSKDVTIKKTTTPTPPTEKITTNKYPLKNAGSTAVIDKISFGTTVDQLKNNLDNQNAKLKVYNISGKEVTGSSLVGTKFVVKLFVNNQEMDKRTLVVLGDVFAQDKVDVNSQDYMMIRQHIMANYKYITDAILLLAADAYSDSTVDSRDYMMIRQIIMAK